MTWHIKWRKSDGSAVSVLSDDLDHAKELFDEQEELGRSPWIEDHQGRKLDRADLDDT